MRLIATLLAVTSLSACAQMDPGGFSAELQPVNVAGTMIHTVTASSWMKTCFGNPDQVTTMLSQFMVNAHGQLVHLASGTTISEGDCNTLIKALGLAAAAKIGAQDINTDSTAITQTTVGVVVN